MIKEKFWHGEQSVMHYILETFLTNISLQYNWLTTRASMSFFCVILSHGVLNMWLKIVGIDVLVLDS